MFETPGLVKRVVQVRSKFTFSAWRIFYLLPFICTTDFWWRLLVNKINEWFKFIKSCCTAQTRLRKKMRSWLWMIGEYYTLGYLSREIYAWLQDLPSRLVWLSFTIFNDTCFLLPLEYATSQIHRERSREIKSAAWNVRPRLVVDRPSFGQERRFGERSLPLNQR